MRSPIRLSNGYRYIEMRKSLSAMPMRVYALIFFLLAGMSYWAAGLHGFDDSVAVEALSLTGFEETQRGVFTAVSGENDFHSLDAVVPLVPDSYYRIKYVVRRPPRERATLVADLFASGYDNPEQEIDSVLGMRDIGKRQDFVFNSGNAPDRAHFRVFYSGGLGLQISNVQLLKVPTWSLWLKGGLVVGALGALFALILSFIRHIRIRRSQLRPVESNCSRTLALELPLLVAIYLAAVLFRFSLYLTMPYWSGDEYVYKSIAAGIWNFGRHGVLTDSMVAHSVDLPNLLYPYLISPAFALGENFYIGVRLINSIVMNLAIFPCYLLARKYLGKNRALVAASLSIAIPFVNLGAFAVTEVLFFPLFLLSVWVAIESIERSEAIGWSIGFGVVAGVLMNVRLNAMILLPAYVLSLIWISLRQRKAKALLVRPYWIGAVIAFLGTYIAIKYALGNKTIGEFGLYLGVAERSESPISVLIADPIGIFHLIVGHLTTLAIPYALPFVLLFAYLVRSRKSAVDDNFYTFSAVASVFSVGLFVLALVFTIGVSPFDLGGLGRWHSRYYFYFYPLIIISGAVFADRSRTEASIGGIPVLTGVAIMLACSFYFINIYGAPRNPWFGSIVDNMDVQWYRSAGRTYWFFAPFSIGLAWFWHKHKAAFSSWWTLFLLVWMAVANYGTLRTAGAGTAMSSDACGDLSQHLINLNPGRFVVVGDSRATLVAAAFWNPYLPEKALVVSGGSRILGPAEVGVAADYLVVNGSIAVDARYRLLTSIGKCAIYEIPN